MSCVHPAPILDELLSAFRGARAFFEPVGGNHGDTLIEMGARHLLDSHGIDIVSDRSLADLAIINGSGSVGVDIWSGDFSGLRAYSQLFFDRPLIVLPSSFRFAGTPFPACFTDRRAPAYLFSRERYSHELLLKQSFPTDVRCGIDHDMSFQLRDSEFVKDLRARAQELHLLIVERFDYETISGTSQMLQVPRALKSFLPRRIRQFAKGIVHGSRASHSSFTKSALALIADRFPSSTAACIVREDISSAIGFTFDQFLEAIANASHVVSTRLHVGILSALAGKPTVICEGATAYPKIRGVYEYSMAHMSNVELWKRDIS